MQTPHHAQPVILMSVIERAEQDIRDGRLWKARDRLNGSLVSRPGDQDCLSLLGDVYWQMKDQPKAGAAWFLTAREDSDAIAGRAAFAERFGNQADAMLKKLTIKAPIADYPIPVQERLRELILRRPFLATNGKCPPRWSSPNFDS